MFCALCNEAIKEYEEFGWAYYPTGGKYPVHMFCARKYLIEGSYHKAWSSP